ncbi:hypothetical protein AWC03_02830 [Mycobacterium europaeum]|nr:hypothetical protein AWC03_02830 [Mycobacterium europaeum]
MKREGHGNRVGCAVGDQLPLWWYCDVCGCPHYWLQDTWLRRVQHRHCGTAMDRWFRSDNRDDWINEPNRAVL